MKFIPYEDVPIRLSNGSQTEYLLAESANLSVNQPTETVRQLNDNLIQICRLQESNSTSTELSYTSFTLFPDRTYSAVLGPTNGPPKPLASSIHKIPKDTPIIFPNNKKLFFKHDVFPDGHNYVVELYCKDNTSLPETSIQNGYIDPIFKSIPTGPAFGSLDVNFYFNSSNLNSFFNLTGMFNVNDHPPINERNVHGNLGDFSFSRAYLNNLSFSLAPNSLSQATANFDIYGQIDHDTSLTESYFSDAQFHYRNHKSIAHGQNSKIVGTTEFDMEHPISCSYSISSNRSATFQVPDSSNIDSERNLMNIPKRVSNTNTVINVSIEGEHLDPSIISEENGSQHANLKILLKDLEYDNFSDNSDGLIQTFSCFGPITSKSLSVDSQGYLVGSMSASQTLR